jgi:hypothetical protein
MNTHCSEARAGSAQRFTTHIITENTAKRRFNTLLDEEHALGSRKAKGRSVYQVICDEQDRCCASGEMTLSRPTAKVLFPTRKEHEQRQTNR